MFIGILFVILVVLLFFKDEPKELAKLTETGIAYFYDIQSPFGSIFLVVGSTLLIPLLYSETINRVDKNNFDQFIIVRKGSKKGYYLNVYLVNFLVTIIYYFILQMVILAVINFFVAPIHLLPHSDYLKSAGACFSQNGFTNLLVYLILSVIGYGVFSSLVLSVGLLIKNTYVFYGLGIIIYLILIIIPAVVGSQINLLLIPSYILMAPSLLTPTLQQIGGDSLPINPIINYLLSICVYSVAIFYLIRQKVKRDS